MMIEKIQEIKDAVLATIVEGGSRRAIVHVSVAYEYAQSAFLKDEPATQDGWVVGATVEIGFRRFNYGIINNPALDAALETMLQNVKNQKLNPAAFGAY